MWSACARAPLDLIARSKREKRAFAIVVPGSKDAGLLAGVAVCHSGRSSPPPSGLNAHLRVSNGASAGHKNMVACLPTKWHREKWRGLPQSRSEERDTLKVSRVF